MQISGRPQLALELVKNCLLKESRTLDCLRRALMLKALDDAARLIVPVLRTAAVICSNECVAIPIRGVVAGAEKALEAAAEQIGHFDEEGPAIAPETGF